MHEGTPPRLGMLALGVWAVPTGRSDLRTLGVQGLAVVQVPPELEQQGRQLNAHAAQLQQQFQASQGTGDALAYLTGTDALLAEGREFNRNWQNWLSAKGYPFERVAEQSAAIDRIRARMHVLLSTGSHANEQVRRGILPSDAQQRAQQAYIDETRKELQRLRPVDFASMLSAHTARAGGDRAGPDGLVEFDGTSVAPLSDIDNWQ